MSFRTIMYGVCLLLMLTIQFLVAQHASVHPVETQHQAHASVSGHDHSDEQDDTCGLCDFIKAVSYSLGGVVPAMMVAMTLGFIAYSGIARIVRQQRIRAASYHSQAPPYALS